jgi:hypothetical protein
MQRYVREESLSFDLPQRRIPFYRRCQMLLPFLQFGCKLRRQGISGRT